MLPQPFDTILSIAILVLSVCLHEAAHAWAAYKLGDPTAYRLGRVTLNPIPHIDPIQTIAMPLMFYFASGGKFIFGGAKPVPINPYLFRNPSKGMMLTGLAGPAVNLLLAGIAGFLYLPFRPIIKLESVGDFLLIYIVVINVFLLVFNLIPIPPLDGSRALRYFLPYHLRERFDRLEQYGMLILMLVIFSPLMRYVNVFRNFIVDTLLVFR
ncbi:MAG: site-2 protease family protein [Planctomycetota bacterium]|nr:site-2 protease family protein [Planctomycetota bacterium]